MATHPNKSEPCYDCGSTIPGHHTTICDLTGNGDIKDLPRKLGTQYWIGEMPEGAGDLRYQELTESEIENLKNESDEPIFSSN